jgi:hypothetical protein
VHQLRTRLALIFSQEAEAEAPAANGLDTLDSIEEEAELEFATLLNPMDAAAQAVTPVTVASPLQSTLPTTIAVASPTPALNTDIALRHDEHRPGAGHSGDPPTVNGVGGSASVSVSAAAAPGPGEDDARNASASAQMSSASASDDGSGDEGARLLGSDARTDSAFEGARFGKGRGRGGEGTEEYVSISIGETNGHGAAGGKEGANGRSGKIIKAEEREVGRVKRTVYLTYLSAWGPWFWVPLSVLALALLERSLQVSSPRASMGEKAGRDPCDGRLGFEPACRVQGYSGTAIQVGEGEVVYKQLHG